MYSIKNNKGFTLIELLAVITLMGILLGIAILGISRIIENVRRSSFSHTSATYLKQVKQAFINDEIHCWVHTRVNDATSDVKLTIASDLERAPIGEDVFGRRYYIVPISTTDSPTKPTSYSTNSNVYNPASATHTENQNKIMYNAKIPDDSGTEIYKIAYRNAQALLEEGGKSPWGDSDIYGYVVIMKDVNGNVTYGIRLGDAGFRGHGQGKSGGVVALGYDLGRTTEVTEEGVTLRSTVRNDSKVKTTRVNFGKYTDNFCYID